MPALCENPALDAIIRYYLEKAREKGIQTEYHLDIPARLSVSDAELSVVFANALENAIRACENLGEGKSKKIMISCASRPKFVMQISNTCGKVSFNQDGFPISSREGHGLGIKSIQAFAEKNNALLDYELNKDTLTMSMLIQ